MTGQVHEIMTHTPDITVLRGTDPSILGIECGDPSGFDDAFQNPREADAFLEIHRQVALSVYAAAPRTLQSIAPRTIPLYIQPSPTASARGTLLRTPSTGPTGQRPPIGKIKGIVVRHPPKTTAQTQVIRTAVHETLHVITTNCLDFSRSVDEAIVTALEKRLVPNAESVAEDASYDLEAKSASCGLRATDFADYEDIPEIRSMPYWIGPLELQFLTTKKIWNLFEAVSEEAHRSGQKAGFAEFVAAARSTLSDKETNRLLETTSVRPVEAGLQQWIFPRKDRRSVRFITANYKPNPDFSTAANHSEEWHGSWLPYHDRCCQFRLLRGAEEKRVVETRNYQRRTDMDFSIETATGIVGHNLQDAGIDTVRVWLGSHRHTRRTIDLTP